MPASALFLFACLGGAQIGLAFARVFLGKLQAVVGGIYGLVEGKFVARNIRRLQRLDLFQPIEKLFLRHYHRIHALVDGQLAAERIIGHGVNGFDDVRVVFQRVVNEGAAAGLLFFDGLRQYVQAKLCKSGVETNAIIRLLDIPNLLHLGGGKEIAVLPERRAVARSERQPQWRTRPDGSFLHCSTLVAYREFPRVAVAPCTRPSRGRRRSNRRIIASSSGASSP